MYGISVQREVVRKCLKKLDPQGVNSRKKDDFNKGLIRVADQIIFGILTVMIS